MLPDEKSSIRKRQLTAIMQVWQRIWRGCCIALEVEEITIISILWYYLNHLRLLVEIWLNFDIVSFRIAETELRPFNNDLKCITNAIHNQIHTGRFVSRLSSVSLTTSSSLGSMTQKSTESVAVCARVLFICDRRLMFISNLTQCIAAQFQNSAIMPIDDIVQ